MKNKEKHAQNSRKIKISYILLLLLFGIFITLFAYRIHLKNKLNSRLNAFHAAGYPLTFEELNDLYSISLGEINSADIIIAANDLYKTFPDGNKLPIIGRAELPGRTESMNEETEGFISQFLDNNKECLELLHKTAGLEYGRYPANFSLESIYFIC